MAERLDLSLAIKTHDVVISGVDGEDVTFQIRELTGKQRAGYMDNLVKRMKYDGGQAVGLTKYSGMQTSLLAMCLFREQGGEFKPVTQQEIDAMPAVVVNALFEKAQTLSGLTNEDDDDEGNG